MSWIGTPLPRPNARRLLLGKGRYVDDKVLPRMVHAAFVRSPHAHARILSVDLSEALAAPGVIAAWDGPGIAPAVEPFVAVLTHLKGMQSAPQPPLACGTTHWARSGTCWTPCWTRSSTRSSSPSSAGSAASPAR